MFRKYEYKGIKIYFEVDSWFDKGDISLILYDRFIRYNYKKYHKYAEEWVNNVLNSNAYNLNYFINESKNE